MKAMLIRRYGGPEVFEAGEVEAPRPGPGEVLVRVRGSSVNPVDTAIRSGMLRFFIRLRMPAVLGVDVAGEVVECGEGANRYAPIFVGVRTTSSHARRADRSRVALRKHPFVLLMRDISRRSRTILSMNAAL